MVDEQSSESDPNSEVQKSNFVRMSPSVGRAVRQILRVACALTLLLPLISSTSLAQKDSVKDAIDVIVMFCVAGGERVEVSSSGKTDEELTVRQGTSDVTISKSEAKGLVDGILQQMNGIAAGQASEARKCMQPYIDRILNVLLQGTPSSSPSAESVGDIYIEWPPSPAPCAVHYEINIGGRVVVPQGPHSQVQGIRLGPTRWTIRGTVSCADGSMCMSPGELQSGSVNLRAGSSYRFFWNVIPGTPRGSECQFALIG